MHNYIKKIVKKIQINRELRKQSENNKYSLARKKINKKTLN